MSIKSELQRISGAKSALRDALNLRGGDVSDTDLVDGYSRVLHSLPYVVKGTFTPESDTRSFILSGLPFAPVTVYIIFSDTDDTFVPDSIVAFGKGKNMVGVAAYVDSDGVYTNITVKRDSSVESWNESGYEINFPSSFGSFKAGCTYEYYVSGGF